MILPFTRVRLFGVVFISFVMQLILRSSGCLLHKVDDDDDVGDDDDDNVIVHLVAFGVIDGAIETVLFLPPSSNN